MSKRLLFSIILILSMAGYSSAQSGVISTGVDWLIANQNSEKSWGGAATSVSPFNTTTAAVSALQLCGDTGGAYNDGLAWLNGQTIDSVNFAAERILVGTVAAPNAAVDRDLILNWRNIEGSWGLDGEYTIDTVEIALALQALKAVNYSDTTVLYQAINFLTTNQNADGGWAFVSGGPSNAYVTAMVLRALSGYSSTFSVQGSIQNASAYLLTKQNADGGFGSSPSNVYETALSVMALIESGQGSTQALQNAINFLTSTQSPNGSWSADPYYTALALQALASARPNLTVSSISFSKSMPQDGEAVTITATVSNIGLEDASGVIVRFYQGDPLAGGVQIGSDQIIPSLSVGASAQVSINTYFSGTGNRTLFVVVDPDGIISETSEADNKASSRIWVATAPDLAVFFEDLKPSTYVPASGAPFPLEYKIRNLGESSVEAFSASLYDGNPASGGTFLQTINISGLAGTEVRTGTIGITLTGDGSHTLYLTADGAPESGGAIIYGTTVMLAAGAEQTITTNWTIAAGIHEVYVVLDRMNGTIESDENNDTA